MGSYPVRAWIFFQVLFTTTSFSSVLKLRGSSNFISPPQCKYVNFHISKFFIINSVDNTKLPCYTVPPMQPHSFFKNFPALFILLSPTTTLVMTKLVLTGVSHCHSFIANKIILGLLITGRPKEDQEFRCCFLTS